MCFLKNGWQLIARNGSYFLINAVLQQDLFKKQAVSCQVKSAKQPNEAGNLLRDEIYMTM